MREGLIGSFPPLAFLPCQEAGPDIVQNGTFLRTPDHDDGVQHPRSQISTRMTPSLLWILMKSSFPLLAICLPSWSSRTVCHFYHRFAIFPFPGFIYDRLCPSPSPTPFVTKSHFTSRFSWSREETRNQRMDFLTWWNGPHGVGVEADQLTASLPIQLSCSYDGAFLPCLTDETSMNSDYSGT